MWKGQEILESLTDGRSASFRSSVRRLANGSACSMETARRERQFAAGRTTCGYVRHSPEPPPAAASRA